MSQESGYDIRFGAQAKAQSLTTHPVSPRPSLAATIGCLEQQIAELATAADKLIDAIDTVLLPSQPEAGPDCVPAPMKRIASKVMDQIDTFTETVACIRRRIEAATARVAL